MLPFGNHPTRLPCCFVAAPASKKTPPLLGGFDALPSDWGLRISFREQISLWLPSSKTTGNIWCSLKIQGKTPKSHDQTMAFPYELWQFLGVDTTETLNKNFLAPWCLKCPVKRIFARVPAFGVLWLTWGNNRTHNASSNPSFDKVPIWSRYWGFPEMGIPPVIIHFCLGFSIINHPFWGTPIYGKPHIFNWSGCQMEPNISWACFIWDILYNSITIQLGISWYIWYLDVSENIFSNGANSLHFIPLTTETDGICEVRGANGHCGWLLRDLQGWEMPCLTSDWSCSLLNLPCLLGSNQFTNSFIPMMLSFIAGR